MGPFSHSSTKRLAAFVSRCNSARSSCFSGLTNPGEKTIARAVAVMRVVGWAITRVQNWCKCNNISYCGVGRTEKISCSCEGLTSWPANACEPISMHLEYESKGKRGSARSRNQAFNKAAGRWGLDPRAISKFPESTCCLRLCSSELEGETRSKPSVSKPSRFSIACVNTHGNSGVSHFW